MNIPEGTYYQGGSYALVVVQGGYVTEYLPCGHVCYKVGSPEGINTLRNCVKNPNRPTELAFPHLQK